MYGLGKLVKKVTRTVKKIAKSPVGKAAIIGGLGYLSMGGAGGIKVLVKVALIFLEKVAGDQVLRSFWNVWKKIRYG